MSSPEEEQPAAAFPEAVSVDSKADLVVLLGEWEEAQQGTTEQLVSILTKSAGV